MAEMQHNQIRSYPFDAEENDEEELQLNERIRVSFDYVDDPSELMNRRCYLSLSLARSEVLSLMANQYEAERADGVSSTSKMNDIVNLSISETSSPGKLSPSLRRISKLMSRTHLQDLIETTAQIHYETFRAKQLLALKESSGKAAAAAQAAAA